MSNYLKLTIASVAQAVFDDEAVSVTVPGVMGEMQLLANHEPLISALKSGAVTIEKKDGEKETVNIDGGVLEVSDNHATILIASADPSAKPE
jgi:F-type H+-transporting ATPase subunit epsilon